MHNPYSALAREHGRRAVVSLAIDDATLDAETARQAAEIMPIIRRLLRGDELTALDYGCGWGRFTGYLTKLPAGGRPLATTGFDPCAEYIAMARPDSAIKYATGDPDAFFSANEGVFDLIFCWVVLGMPGLDVPKTVAGLASMLSPTGLMVLGDHMADTPPRGRWWRFRPQHVYQGLFRRHGISLWQVQECLQVGDPITVLAGRRT